MNPVFREAAEQLRLGWLMGVMTAVFLVTFLGWTWWAWSKRNQAALEEASRLPFQDGGDS
jgi:cbb3-type cytochrome oxidase subunit 3